MKKLLAIVLCLALCMGALAITASAEGTTYYVAGTKALCGSEWSCNDANNAMTDNGDGTHSITYKDVPAGSHAFKITDGTWDNSWNGNVATPNYELYLETECDVTITFNTSDKSISVDASGAGTLRIEVVGIRGDSDKLAAVNWDNDVTMTETSDAGYGIWEYTFKNVPANSYPEIKFTTNNDWAVNFGCEDSSVGATSGTAHNAVCDGSNIWFEVKELSDVHVKLDLSNFDADTKTGATYTITVTPASADDDGDTGSDTEPANTIKVHAKVPADWTEASAYVWVDGANGEIAWPGTAMEKGADGWYTLEIPSGVDFIIINNNNNGKQTQDIELTDASEIWIVVEASENGGFFGTLTESNPDTGDNLITVCAAMLLAGAAVVTTVAGKKRFF